GMRWRPPRRVWAARAVGGGLTPGANPRAEALVHAVPSREQHRPANDRVGGGGIIALRHESPARAAAACQPGLVRLAQLVEAARRARPPETELKQPWRNRVRAGRCTRCN